MIANLATPDALFSFLINQSYTLIFILMVIEGPIITAIAAFAASIGYLNIYLIFLLSFLGNTVPDIILFYIGRLGRKTSILVLLNKLGLNSKHIRSLENGMKKHAGKTIVLSKSTPFLPIPGLILAGFTKVPFRRFIIIDSIFNLVSAIIACAFGFYFGLVTNEIMGYFKIGEYVLFLIIPLVIIFYIIYKKVSSVLGKSVEIKNKSDRR